MQKRPTRQNTRVTNKIKNKHGVELSYSEYAKFQESVNKLNQYNANKKRRIENQPYYSMGQKTGMTIGERMAMESNSYSQGYKSRYGFLNRTLSVDIDSFKSKEDIKAFQKRMRHLQTKTYENKKLQQYKKNYIKAIYNKLGITNETMKIVSRLRRTKASEIESIYMTNDEAHIGFVYNLADGEYKVEALKSLFGIK